MSEQSKVRLKPMQFVVEFKGKPKNDTEYFSTSEKCLVSSGLCMLEMKWPKEGKIKLIEKSAYQKAVDALRKIRDTSDENEMEDVADKTLKELGEEV